MPTAPQRILVVAAHPDDAEFGCGGTVARLISFGFEAYYLIATNGDKGDDSGKYQPEQLAAIRKNEQADAAAVLGIKEVFFLDNPDGSLLYSIALRGSIVRFIRQLKPDLVFTHDPTVHIFADGSGVNHCDHRVTGETTLDAVYPFARGVHQYPEHMQEGLQPHKVRELYLWGTNEANHFEDVEPYVERKLEALLSHRSQFAEPEKMRKFTMAHMEAAGIGAGLDLAESFRKLVFE